MAPTKAELQLDRDGYYGHLDKALQAEAQGKIRVAIAAAEASWAHVNGMLQFERKFEKKEHASVETIDLVLRLAPLTFEASSLAKLEALLRTQRSVDKNTSSDLQSRLADAIQDMWLLRELWSQLEAENEVESETLRRKLDIDARRWRQIIEAWESLGVVQRSDSSGAIRLATRMREIVFGKCPSCGVGAKATKSKLMEQLNCPKCKNSVRFVLVSRPASALKE